MTMMKRHGLLLILLLPLTLWAQDRRLHVLRTGSGHGVEQKIVSEVVTSLDPGAKFSCEGDRLKVLLHAAVPAQELMTALEHGGAGRFVAVYVKHAGTGRGSSALPPHFPTLVDTGDPMADEAAFAAAKAAWREAYPEEYAAYMESLPPNTNSHGTPASDR
jgi:hypothetical protein